MIKIKNLDKYFNKGKSNEIHVIDNISLDLPSSGMVAIFGKSGCGKTTLLNVIGGLDGYMSGTLTIDGNDIRRSTDDLRNKYIGYIFQNYNLNKTESCYNNVADALRLCGMPDGDELDGRVMAALSNVGMENYHARTPDTLSGGQQQRIAIARAIVKNPKIILADEPTGNLDEANTVMIMDLLKQIAKDHLVILVTHEANLVDYYCDTVIELKDGKVVGVKNNTDANGYVAKGKNDIYLGELQKSEISDENAQIEFYGDAPEQPIKLKIVNNGGKLYLRIDTEKVQILDATSEVKFREGVYESVSAKNEKAENIDMSKLPPVDGHRLGRLFTFKSAIKSGYAVNFKKKKFGKKILRICMCLFAAVVVLMSAVFGTAFSDLRDARNSYNHNVFYLYTPDGEVSEKINTAMQNGGAGIDYTRLYYGVPYGDLTLKFMSGYFESFTSSAYDDTYKTNAVVLDVSLISDLPVTVGKKAELSNGEMVITTRVADALLELSTLGYIKEYSDLIGMITTGIRVDGQNMRIAGVVDSDESAVYLSKTDMAKYILTNFNTQVSVSDENSFQALDGEAVLATRYSNSKDIKLPNVGDSIKIHGVELKVAKIIKYSNSYHEWMKENGFKTYKDSMEYFRDKVQSEYPELNKNSYDFDMKVNELWQSNRFEYYEDYYAHYDEYMSDCYLFDGNSNMDVWLYTQKGIEEIKYREISEEYYYALKYKEENGRYPTESELHAYTKNNDKLYRLLEEYNKQYQDEFNRLSRQSISNMYYVSEADYVKISKQLGETHESATLSGNNTSDNLYKEDVYVDSVVVGSSVDISYYPSDLAIGGSNICYTIIHSSNPKQTEEWLNSEFSNLDTGRESRPAILTPDEIFESNVADKSQTIIRSMITMAVILILMSLCMYFIMRSALLNRIKEIGIYRAIGVSKKNLVFRFLIEAFVLATLTVFIGYLLTSAFMGVCLGMSPLMEKMLYYPVWLAGVVLCILYAICLLFGTLPVISLLRKTPSEILAKYDI